AAEMAIRASERRDARVGRVVLIGAVGVAVPEHAIPDVSTLTPDQLGQLAHHDPQKFRIDPAALDDAQRAALAGNRAALATSGGGPAMIDPTLRARLAAVTVPVLVLSGESDGIVTPPYARAFAAAIPGARYQLLPATGHLAQIETPEAVLAAVSGFLRSRNER